MSSYRDLIGNPTEVHGARADWFTGVRGIVAEADPSTMAVKVILPDIDEGRVHDEWVEALVPWVGVDGYGPAGVPEIGTEVVLFSTGGEGLTLFYLSRFNEDYRVPAEFADGSRGCKCDRVYRLLCDLLVQIVSLTEVQLRGESKVDIESGVGVDADAPDVRLKSGGAVSVHAQGAKVGFLGAAPVGVQSLPGEATNLPTCIALANALRRALIAFGQCG